GIWEARLVEICGAEQQHHSRALREGRAVDLVVAREAPRESADRRGDASTSSAYRFTDSEGATGRDRRVMIDALISIGYDR
ncbi:MAG: hypothetical protein ACHQAV_07420, partial [Solirubrobacterales bacterium]